MKENPKQFLQELKAQKQNPHEAEDRELDSALDHISEIAKEFKLDPFPTEFDVVPPHVIYTIGSYGLPNRFSHWSYGRDYWKMKTSYDYGLSRIYEVVINSDPSQAFLLENNPPIENKVVMAHVLGHTDFFKNNHLFKGTRRDMPELASLHAQRLLTYENTQGKEKVEKVLDAVLAIQEHIDPHRPDRPYREEELREWKDEWKKRKKPIEAKGEFVDLFQATEVEKPDTRREVFPPDPDKDLLGIIRNHAPYLEEWERDAVDIVRNESQYFYPQYRTKIMNEGWASYWHLRIMREMSNRDLITPAEDEHFMKMHAGVIQPNPEQINPYYLGLKMFEYIEEYHNGKLTEQENKWLKDNGYPVYPKFEGNFKDSPGLKKIREVMQDNDDQSFIRNYFNKITADRMNMYIYETEELTNGSYTYVKDKGWMEIRDKLVESMDNCGNPYLVSTDIDYKQKQELYIKHNYDGQELEAQYVEKTLPYIQSLWRKPVHIETQTETRGKTVYSFDGKTLKTEYEKDAPQSSPPMWGPWPMKKNP